MAPGLVPLLCGLQFLVEGSVVGVFVHCWSEVAEGGVNASLVVPVDPVGGGVPDVGDGGLGRVVEESLADAFGLGAVDGSLRALSPTLPVDGFIPSRVRCSVNRIAVYYDPASLW